MACLLPFLLFPPLMLDNVGYTNVVAGHTDQWDTRLGNTKNLHL